MSAGTVIQGTVEKIMNIDQINDTFKKRDVVINTGGEYPQKISIQFVNDQCHLFDSILEGENVLVDVNIRGREWNAPDGSVKYFNTLQGWRVQTIDGAGAGTPPKPTSQKPNSTEEAILEQGETEDDLPF